MKTIDASNTASLLSVIDRTKSRLLFVRCRVKKRRKRASTKRAHEPTGDFIYPIRLPAIGRFDILNEVQVNVFRLVAV